MSRMNHFAMPEEAARRHAHTALAREVADAGTLCEVVEAHRMKHTRYEPSDG